MGRLYLGNMPSHFSAKGINKNCIDLVAGKPQLCQRFEKIAIKQPDDLLMDLYSGISTGMGYCQKCRRKYICGIDDHPVIVEHDQILVDGASFFHLNGTVQLIFASE